MQKHNIKRNWNHPKLQNTKITFDDKGNTISRKCSIKSNKKHGAESRHNNKSEIGIRWFDEFAIFNTKNDLVELKETEVKHLVLTCKLCFEAEQIHFRKKNPSDAKWLETAINKGTSRDRANAGALLVQSNALGNLPALQALIGLSKTSNKFSFDYVDVITELCMNALLPPNRKLISLQQRGADWKALRKDNIDSGLQDKIMSYWHFESELQEYYFEFLRHLQSAIQGNQETIKNQAIICASKLLIYSPEKEQLLLSMLVNKLGDPSNKVASKAFYHLTDVAYKHPAMCEVITKETEKLLFRNNITENAHRFALCLLAQIAPQGNAEVCTRLVHICFSFFKIVVQKGAVNTKTMHAILRCLKRAIVDAHTDTPDLDKSNLLTKDIQDTMYRLVHLADIHITLQTLALLLQIMTVKSGKYDRFYNALYKKMLDINISNVGPKAAAQFLHIIHRAVYLDANISRALAFIKRLLQVAFYMPVQICCGSLIIIQKLLKSRPELNKVHVISSNDSFNSVKKMKAFEGDYNSKRKYTENAETITDSHNIDVLNEQSVSQKSSSKYNPFHRVPTYAGAEFVLKTELLKLTEHFHPTVQVFARNIIEKQHINFYGDPLRDFCLSQFLERFSFRNPKKIESKSVLSANPHEKYSSYGSRGLPVKTLTKINCTEDEKFIFDYLQYKREKASLFKDDDKESIASIDDDEFESYLNSMGKEGGVDENLDFMTELGEELKENEDIGKTIKKRKTDNDVEIDSDDNGDWNMNDKDEEDSNEYDYEDDEINSDENYLKSNGDDDDDELDIFEEDSSSSDDDSGENEPKSKKLKTMSGKAFRKSLQNTDDMNSLFAAADDFSEMLEETGKSKGHGTLGDIYNKDKSSEKQLNWEQNRLNSSVYSKRRSFKKTFGNKKKSVNKKKK